MLCRVRDSTWETKSAELASSDRSLNRGRGVVKGHSLNEDDWLEEFRSEVVWRLGESTIRLLGVVTEHWAYQPCCGAPISLE